MVKHKTVSEQYDKMEKERDNAIKMILSAFYASMEKTNDIEKSIIFSVSKYIKNNHGFVDLPIVFRKYENKVNNSIKRVGENYDPFVETVFAIRKI